MLTAEKRVPEASVKGASGLAEPGQLDAAEIFGRRRVQTNSWQPQDHLFSLILSPPHSEKREDGTVVLSTAEISMERISLTPGPAVIELTDEEAKEIADSFGGDAFPQQ
jgi:hypothetical protein